MVFINIILHYNCNCPFNTTTDVPVVWSNTYVNKKCIVIGVNFCSGSQEGWSQSLPHPFPSKIAYKHTHAHTRHPTDHRDNMTVHAYRACVYMSQRILSVYPNTRISRVRVFILTSIIIIILFHFLHNLSCARTRRGV